jgi:tetratricopeptide (TPR) repeat protein
LCLVREPLRVRLRAVGGGFALLGGLAFGIVLLRRAVLGGEFAGVFVSEALQGRGVGDRALTLLQIVPQWTRLLIWPVRLQADYAPQELVASSAFGLRESLGLGIVAAALTGAWLARRRAPAITLGVLWLAITLFPVSNLLTPTGFLLAERTLFLPSVGFALALGGLLALRPIRELGWLCAALVVLGVVRSAERQRVWRNEAFFTVRGVQDAPKSYRAQRAYGEVLFFLGRKDLALEAYDRAKSLAPTGQVWRVRNDLARRYRGSGETQLEVEELQRSLDELPSQEDTRGHLIAGLLLLGRYADAARQIDSALARGAPQEAFRELRALADSAARTGAPPGSIRVRPVVEPAR